jgi:hypothetical protein
MNWSRFVVEYHRRPSSDLLTDMSCRVCGSRILVSDLTYKPLGQHTN